MIYDRTEQDVTDAKKIRDEKVKNFLELTEDELSVLEKGFLTINTISRIENTQVVLAQKIQEMGYFGFNCENKTWNARDVFFADDFKRIVSNNEQLRKAFVSVSTFPMSASENTTYDNLNKIEKLLYDLQELSVFIQDNYSECGNVECGGVRL